MQDSKESVHLFMRKSLVDANDCSGKLGIAPGESKNTTDIGPYTLLLHLLRFDFCFSRVSEMSAEGGTLQHAVQAILISKGTLYILHVSYTGHLVM